MRGSVDAVIAGLSDDDEFAARLDGHDTKSRHDSTLVYRWGVELGRKWELPDPCAYASALTDSAAIFRPSLATREGRASHPSEEERLTLEGMLDRGRILRGQPTSDEMAR